MSTACVLNLKVRSIDKTYNCYVAGGPLGKLSWSNTAVRQVSSQIGTREETPSSSNTSTWTGMAASHAREMRINIELGLMVSSFTLSDVSTSSVLSSSSCSLKLTKQFLA